MRARSAADCVLEEFLRSRVQWCGKIVTQLALRIQGLERRVHGFNVVEPAKDGIEDGLDDTIGRLAVCSQHRHDTESRHIASWPG